MELVVKGVEEALEDGPLAAEPVQRGEFLVNGEPRLQGGLFELGMHVRYETVCERNPVERIFQEILLQRGSYHRRNLVASACMDRKYAKLILSDTRNQTYPSFDRA